MQQHEQQQQSQWIPCRVYPGMFSDEVVVEINNHSFFVPKHEVKKENDDHGTIHVTIIEFRGKRWAVVPTNTMESIPLT